MKSRSRILFAFPLVVMLIAAPRPAEAKIFEVWGTAMGGGIFGDGSATSDRDFFKWAGGGGAGVEVGVRFLFLGAWIDYIRFFGGDAGANLMSINLGGDTTVSLTKHLKLVLRLGGTFYYGTIDNAVDAAGVSTNQVNTRGVGFRGGVGLRYVFARIFSFGVTPEGAYHYFFGGADDNALDTGSNSHGWSLRLMGYFRVGLGF